MSYSISQRLADLGLCLRFFSRLPVPPLSVLDEPSRKADFSEAAMLVPLAGSIIALPAAVVGSLLALTNLPSIAVGAIIVAALALSTGALHEDGLGDTADGFFGGRTKEMRLAIMRDSRIGSFAGVALILTLVVRASIYGVLAEDGVIFVALGILASAAVSRALMVALWHVMVPARPDGLSASVGQPSRRAMVGAFVLAGLMLLPLFWVIGPVALLIGLFLSAAAALVVGQWAQAKIEGQTGDVLGACQQVTELCFLVGISILPLAF